MTGRMQGRRAREGYEARHGAIVAYPCERSSFLCAKGEISHGFLFSQSISASISENSEQSSAC
jgi:hypothetical protein